MLFICVLYLQENTTVPSNYALVWTPDYQCELDNAHIGTRIRTTIVDGVRKRKSSLSQANLS